MKSINTSYFDFAVMRDPAKNCVYVDKTAQLYELVKPTAEGIYYLTRPRRFGKSLMISTLKYLFQGRRDLFRGLWIDSSVWDWDSEVYPVLHLDMSNVENSTSSDLRESLNYLVKAACEEHGVPYLGSKSPPVNFKGMLAELKRKSPSGKFVLLIDEYDAPIAGLLDDPSLRKMLPRVRKALHDFYVQAKAECGHMRFLVVTGVSKFAKTSIFSAFNNPCDLTFDARAADLLGYTHEELETYFHDHIQAFADQERISYEAMFERLLEWYDSYQFSPDRPVKVVNPVSLGRALANQKFGNYWEATAGSTLIFEALKAANRGPADFAMTVNAATLDAPDALSAPTAALLYQGGYLTIEGRGADEYDDPEDAGQILRLRIPNNEVRLSLERGYMGMVLGKDFALDDFQRAAGRTARTLALDGVGEKLNALLKTAYSKLPHDWACKDEREAKRYFLAFMVFARADVAGEEQHSLGRPDAVLRTEKGIYVFEFKYGRSAEAALAQCRDRRYGDAFATDGRRVYYVGVNYDPDARTVAEALCEEAKPGRPPLEGPASAAD